MNTRFIVLISLCCVFIFLFIILVGVMWRKERFTYTVPHVITAVKNHDSSTNLSTTVIPRRIMIVFRSSQVDPNLHNNIQNLLDLNPTFDVIFYTNHQSETFLQQYFSNNVLKAYRTLIPGAYQADLFRYCYVYIHGGVYVDMGKRCMVPFDSIFDPSQTSLLLVKDINYGDIFQAFFASRPYSPFLKQCIDQCVEHVLSHFYGENPLHPTGPKMMGEVFHRYFGKSIGDFADGEYRIKNEHIVVLTHTKDIVTYQGRHVITTQPLGNHSKRLSIWKKTYGIVHYGSLWHRRQIYHPYVMDYRIHAKQRPSSFRNDDIPYRMVTTFRSSVVDHIIQKNIDTLLELNPSYELIFYDDLSCISFLERHFPSKVLDAFQLLKAGAFRADLFRYCELYIHGGVYIDINKRILVPLDDILERSSSTSISPFTMMLVKDKVFRLKPDDIYQAFFACRPRSPFLKQCIDQCVDMILQRKYGEDPLDVTGPSRMGKVFRTYFGISVNQLHERNPWTTIRGETILCLCNTYHRTIIKTSRPVVNTQPRMTYSARLKQWHRDYKIIPYGKLWKRRKIYGTLYALLFILSTESESVDQDYRQRFEQWLQDSHLSIFVIVNGSKIISIEHPRFRQHCLSPSTGHRDKNKYTLLSRCQDYFDLDRFDMVISISPDLFIPRFETYLSDIPSNVHTVVQSSYDTVKVQDIDIFGIQTCLLKECSSLASVTLSMKQHLFANGKQLRYAHLPPIYPYVLDDSTKKRPRMKGRMYI